MTSRRCVDAWTLGGNSDAPPPAWLTGASPNTYLTGSEGNGDVVASAVPNRPSSTGLGNT